MLKGKVFINEQERKGNYTFIGGRLYMTYGFSDTFGEETLEIVHTALALI